MAQSHHPHPGLHVVVEIHIYTKERAQWSEYSNDVGSRHIRTVLVEVPKHIPFESISAWVGHRHVSEGPIKWWYEFAMQQPEEAAKISNNGSLKVAVGVGKILSYVQADGSPYDVRPLHKDRANRILSDEVSERQSSKAVIENVVMESIPRLFAKISFSVFVSDCSYDTHPYASFKVNLPIKYSEAENVLLIHRNRGSGYYSDRLLDEVGRENPAIIDDINNELLAHEDYYLTIDATCSGMFTEDGVKVSINSKEFNRNKALEAIGQE